MCRKSPKARYSRRPNRQSETRLIRPRPFVRNGPECARRKNGLPLTGAGRQNEGQGGPGSGKSSRRRGAVGPPWRPKDRRTAGSRTGEGASPRILAFERRTTMVPLAGQKAIRFLKSLRWVGQRHSSVRFSRFLARLSHRLRCAMTDHDPALRRIVDAVENAPVLSLSPARSRMSPRSRSAGAPARSDTM